MVKRWLLNMYEGKKELWSPLNSDLSCSSVSSVPHSPAHFSYCKVCFTNANCGFFLHSLTLTLLLLLVNVSKKSLNSPFFSSSGIFLMSRSIPKIKRSAFSPSGTHIPCPYNYFWNLAYSSHLCLFQQSGTH